MLIALLWLLFLNQLHAIHLLSIQRQAEQEARFVALSNLIEPLYAVERAAGREETGEKTVRKHKPVARSFCCLPVPLPRPAKDVKYKLILPCNRADAAKMRPATALKATSRRMCPHLLMRDQEIARAALG